MKILMATDRYAIGGGLEYILQLAKGSPDHEFLVLSSSGSPPKELASLPNVRCLVGRLDSALLVRESPDLVHTNHLRSLLQAFPLLCRKANRRTPFVNTVHGVHLHQFEFRSGLANRLKSALRRSIEGWCLRRMDQNILLNDLDLQFVRKHLGVRGGIVIPNGISRPNLEPLPSGIERSWAEDPAVEMKFLTISRFHFQKGYPVLLEAIRLIESLRPGHRMRFAFAGDGPELERCRNLVQETGIGERVRFLGRVANASRLMPLADCLILPSLWEGFPLTLLEAAHAKLPVIASRTYGNTEVVEDKVTGLLFQTGDPRDLARTILDAFDRRDQLGEYARAAAVQAETRFTLGRMVESTLSCYREVLSRRQVRP